MVSFPCDVIEEDVCSGAVGCRGLTGLDLMCSASGHVYVAKTLATGKKVAIKEMDLANQPRKELIVNEILVMKESQHPNIVNFLNSYLVKNNELWVVMEFMEGGALTDIIENNNLEEDQIACISLEVRVYMRARITCCVGN